MKIDIIAAIKLLIPAAKITLLIEVELSMMKPRVIEINKVPKYMQLFNAHESVPYPRVVHLESPYVDPIL